MKSNFLRVANLIILIFGITVIGLGTFYKHISFGMGLGDLIGYFFMYLIVIMHLTLTIRNRKRENNNYHIIMVIIFLIIWFFVVIKATVGRGPEYRWNGKLFYGLNLKTNSGGNANVIF